MLFTESCYAMLMLENSKIKKMILATFIVEVQKNNSLNVLSKGWKIKNIFIVCYSFTVSQPCFVFLQRFHYKKNSIHDKSWLFTFCFHRRREDVKIFHIPSFLYWHVVELCK